MSPRGATAWVAVFAALVLLAVQTIEDGSPERGDDRPGSDSSGADSGSKPRVARVLRAVDGDTILVRTVGGRSERVRYIGVDTPESVKPNSPVECYGKQAANFNRELVEGREVRLVPDREPRDHYGRTLAYVYVGSSFVNAELVENGFARTIEIEPNTTKAEYFARLERVAIRTNTGLWGVCDR